MTIYDINIVNDDILDDNILINNINKLQLILDSKNYEQEHLEKLIIYKRRFEKKLEIFNKKNSKIIKPSEDKTIIPTNICVFDDTSKNYFVLVYMPTITENNLIPDLMVVCHTNVTNKMMLTPLCDTRIGLIYKDLITLTRTIAHGQWKCCKLGNDKTIFNEETNKILEIGNIIDNNKKEIIKELYSDITDNDIDIKYEDYIRLKYIISTLNWEVSGITNNIKDKINKWTNKKNVFASRNLLLNRSNGKLSLKFENCKIGEDYNNIINIYDNVDNESNYINERLWEITLLERSEYTNDDVTVKLNKTYKKKIQTTKTMSLQKFHELVNNKNKTIKSGINSRCPNMLKSYGCTLKNCKFKHPIGWESKIKYVINEEIFEYKHQGVLRTEARNAMNNNITYTKKQYVWIEDLQEFDNVSVLDQIKWLENKQLLKTFCNKITNNNIRNLLLNIVKKIINF